MSLTINQTGLTCHCNQLTTERQRNRAVNFINKSDEEVSQMAARLTHIQNHEKNKKITKNLNAAFNTLPIIAFASGLAMKRGIKPSLKNAAEWGLAVAIPAVINKTHNNINKKNDKNSNLSFGLGLGLSLAGFFGATALLEKAARNPKVNKIVDTVIDGAKDTYKKVRSEIKVPEKITTAMANLKSKVKVPEAVKNAYNNVMRTDTAKKITEVGKNLGKGIVNNAPMLVALGIITTIFGVAVKQSKQTANTKKEIQNCQLDTARNLVDFYRQDGVNKADA